MIVAPKVLGSIPFCVELSCSPHVCLGFSHHKKKHEAGLFVVAARGGTSTWQCCCTINCLITNKASSSFIRLSQTGWLGLRDQALWTTRLTPSGLDWAQVGRSTESRQLLLVSFRCWPDENDVVISAHDCMWCLISDKLLFFALLIG